MSIIAGDTSSKRLALSKKRAENETSAEHLEIQAREQALLAELDAVIARAMAQLPAADVTEMLEQAQSSVTASRSASVSALIQIALGSPPNLQAQSAPSAAASQSDPTSESVTPKTIHAPPFRPRSPDLRAPDKCLDSNWALRLRDRSLQVASLDANALSGLVEPQLDHIRSHCQAMRDRSATAARHGGVAERPWPGSGLQERRPRGWLQGQERHCDAIASSRAAPTLAVLIVLGGWRAGALKNG